MNAESSLREAVGLGAPHASFPPGTGEQANGTPCPCRLEMPYCQSELSAWDSGFNLQEETVAIPLTFPCYPLLPILSQSGASHSCRTCDPCDIEEELVW